MPNPLEKAKEFQQILEEEKKNQEEKNKQNKVEELRNSLKSEEEYNSSRTQTYNDNQAKIRELQSEIKGSTGKRKDIQNESKLAVSELIKTEEGREVIKADKENPIKQEIFNDAILALRELAPIIDKNKKALRLLEEEMNNERNVNQSVKHERINNFQRKYPEINEIHKKLSYIEQSQRFYERELGEINFLLTSAKYQPFLNDEIKYQPNRYNKIIEVGIENRKKELEEKLLKIRSERNQKEEVLRSTKKGFFQSQDSFRENIKKEFEKLRNQTESLERGIIHGDSGIQNLGILQDDIEQRLDGFMRTNLGFSDEKRIEMFKEAQTVGGLFEYIKRSLTKKIDENKLSEEEQLIVDLNSELWRS